MHTKNIIDRTCEYMTLVNEPISTVDRYLNWSSLSRSFARIMRQHYSLIVTLFRDPRRIIFVSRSSPTHWLRHDRFRTISARARLFVCRRSILSRFRDLPAALSENDEWIRSTRSKTSPFTQRHKYTYWQERVYSDAVIGRTWSVENRRASTRQQCINKM